MDLCYMKHIKIEIEFWISNSRIACEGDVKCLEIPRAVLRKGKERRKQSRKTSALCNARANRDSQLLVLKFKLSFVVSSPRIQSISKQLHSHFGYSKRGQGEEWRQSTKPDWCNVVEHGTCCQCNRPRCQAVRCHTGS